jgi:transposase
LHRKGVTLLRLWQEYRQANAGARTWAYTPFCGDSKAFAASLGRSMRQNNRTGEDPFIDYAGPGLAPG